MVPFPGIKRAGPLLQVPHAGFEHAFCLLCLPLSASLCAQLISHCSLRVRCDVNQKALGDVRRKGAGGTSDALRLTQLMLPGLTVLDTCSALLRLSCFYHINFFLSLHKANNSSRALFTSRRAARTYLCLCLHPLLSKNVPLFYLLAKHFY